MCTEARYDGNVTWSSEVTQEALLGRTADPCWCDLVSTERDCHTEADCKRSDLRGFDGCLTRKVSRMLLEGPKRALFRKPRRSFVEFSTLLNAYAD